MYEYLDDERVLSGPCVLSERLGRALARRCLLLEEAGVKYGVGGWHSSGSGKARAAPRCTPRNTKRTVELSRKRGEVTMTYSHVRTLDLNIPRILIVFPSSPSIISLHHLGVITEKKVEGSI